MPALAFDETHGTCCPVPFKEQSRAKQHAAPAIWIRSLILRGQRRCLSHSAVSRDSRSLLSLSFWASFLSIACFLSLTLPLPTHKHTQHVGVPTVRILPSPLPLCSPLFLGNDQYAYFFSADTCSKELRRLNKYWNQHVKRKIKNKKALLWLKSFFTPPLPVQPLLIENMSDESCKWNLKVC